MAGMYVLVVPNILITLSGNITLVTYLFHMEISGMVTIFSFRELVLLPYQRCMFTADYALIILCNYLYIILSHLTLKSSVTNCNQYNKLVFCVGETLISSSQHERRHAN